MSPLIENHAHPRRLQFGFAPELEQIVHDKVESSADLYVIYQRLSSPKNINIFCQGMKKAVKL